MENKNLYRVLGEYAEEVINVYRQKLQSNNKNASHELERSLDYRIDDSGDEINVILLSADHIEFVEEGRLPTRNGGTGEVQRKIEEWIIQKNLPIRPNKNGTIPSIKSLSFLISRKIHTEGYKGSGLLKETIEEVYPRYEERINEAIDMDISEYVLVAVDTTIRNIFKN